MPAVRGAIRLPHDDMSVNLRSTGGSERLIPDVEHQREGATAVLLIEQLRPHGDFLPRPFPPRNLCQSSPPAAPPATMAAALRFARRSSRRRERTSGASGWVPLATGGAPCRAIRTTWARCNASRPVAWGIC